MRILIAEDDPVSRRVLEATLRRWGHEVEVTCNGAEAWERLQEPSAPRVAILDWMMPEVDGVEVCRRVRALPGGGRFYLILLTAKGESADVVTGLDAGADDYVVKPFDRQELHARLRAGERLMRLQEALAQRVRELEDTLAEVKTLQGILPICSYCKNVRDDQDYWQQVEAYLGKHSGVQFSHGICPGCWDSVVKPELESLARAKEGPSCES